MSSFDRRDFCTLVAANFSALLLSQCSTPPPPPIIPVTSVPPGVPAPQPVPVYHGRLPWNTVFKGEDKFYALTARAQSENWAALPLARRTATVGRALAGTRYGNYTLEIDDRVEAPSVNLYALDCWTFYEVSLAFARVIGTHPGPWSPVELLRMVEMERYRNGLCDAPTSVACTIWKRCLPTTNGADWAPM